MTPAAAAAAAAVAAAAVKGSEADAAYEKAKIAANVAGEVGHCLAAVAAETMAAVTHPAAAMAVVAVTKTAKYISLHCTYKSPYSNTQACR